MESTAFSNAILLDVIRTQTEIASLGLDLGGIMTLVAQRAEALTRANGAAIEIAEEKEMVYRAATGVAASQIGLRLQRNGSLSGLCVQSGEALACADSESDPRVNREACRILGLRSMLVVPLKHGDMIVGVLKVMAPQTDAFTQADRCLLGLMSDLIGAAMFHAGKYGADELHLKATHDAMTGLPNRALFFDRLRQALDTAKNAREKVAVISIKMKGLARLNDVYGPRAGDAAITELVSRLKATAPRSGVIGRMDAGDFAVLLPHAGATTGRLEIMRMQEQAKLPARFGELPLKLDVGLGLAVFPDDAAGATVLLDCADRDMYARTDARAENRARFA